MPARHAASDSARIPDGCAASTGLAALPKDPVRIPDTLRRTSKRGVLPCSTDGAVRGPGTSRPRSAAVSEDDPLTDTRLPAEIEPVPIDRAFVRLSTGLVHYRSAGVATTDGLPLYMAHSGPGSSLGLSAMIGHLGRTRRVIAPDLPGNGDSDPPAIAAPDLRYYVDGVVRLLDALGIDRVDFYGQHGGAHIGCELAVVHPDRVGRIILDGFALFDAPLKALLVERYAPRVVPDEHGGHLAWAWMFVQDLTLHFPYFLRDPAHRLHSTAVPTAARRQALAVDLIKALPTYHLAYQAVFAHPAAERLPLIGQPTLVMGANGDPLADYVDAVAALVGNARIARTSRELRHVPIDTFLATGLEPL
jgi:pimeloyl-ACP methyl ester carboxylesterase